jgi:hypothetical protein
MKLILNGVRIAMVILMGLNGSFAFSAQATKANAATNTKQNLGPIVQEAYEKAMNAYFLSMSNAMKKAKTAKEFLLSNSASISDTEKAKIESTFGSKPSPQALIIKNGIEISFDGGKFTLQMTPNAGEILVDGHAFAFNEGNEQETHLFLKLYQLVVPSAEAQLASVAGRMLKTIVVTTAKWTAGGIAAGAVTGGLVGCAAGMALKSEETQYPKACSEHAQEMALLMSGLVGFSSASAGPSMYTIGFAEEMKMAGYSEAEIALVTSKLGPLVKGLGVFGALAAAGFTVKGIMQNEGAKIQCRENGNYRIIPLHLGAQDGPSVMGYSSDGNMPGTLSLLGYDLKPTESEVQKFLVEQKGFKPAQATQFAQALVKEHQEKVTECKKQPNKDIKVISTSTKGVAKEADKAVIDAGSAK